MSDSFPNPDIQQELNAFFSQEEFIAFFDFYLPGSGGKMLNGLCKVARPADGHSVNYLCLTFVVDTPNDEAEKQIERLLAKFDLKALREQLPSLQSLTSVPASMRHSENYVHQMDLIFPKDKDLDLREVVPMLLFSLRKATGFKTESPQWWDEVSLDAPKPTEAEKANWGNRLKAIFKAVGKK
ncbi:hypothetical protein H5P28_07270 [Ruficoccus amylovorans]|uniref:Uncharacterized protein n=1 Tax=Ruficoccus amylovorans TaxID=1804625 RepID=A0A842HCT5_9BACT|nr:hypothetical protein [Ruficoccus amylovorans]MBC2594060.1 hypothetical protein [Ruficoccus amylovorans]